MAKWTFSRGLDNIIIQRHISETLKRPATLGLAQLKCRMPFNFVSSAHFRRLKSLLTRDDLKRDFESLYCSIIVTVQFESQPGHGFAICQTTVTIDATTVPLTFDVAGDLTMFQDLT